jgi:hypothetical protein
MMMSRWSRRRATALATSLPVQSYAGACCKDFIQIQLFAESGGGSAEDG